MKGNTVEELRADLLEKQAKITAEKMAELDRKQQILDVMPDACADRVRYIFTHKPLLYGSIGGIEFATVGLAGVEELMDAYAPISMVTVQGGSFKVFCPETNADAQIAKYGGTAQEIAPFLIKAGYAGSMRKEVKIVWFAQLSDDVQVRCTAVVYESEIPEYSHLGTAPDWLHYQIEWGGVNQYDRSIVKSDRAWLDMPSASAFRSIKWARGSRKYPHSYTFYSTHSSLRIGSLLTDEEK